MNSPAQQSCTLAELAERAGLSKTAVSFALRNRPGVAPSTRNRVKILAREMGYCPDPKLSSLMSATRKSTEKNLLPLVWLNRNEREDAWHHYPYMAPYLAGASERARELGFYLEEIWQKARGMSINRISRLIADRGIDGIVVTRSFRPLALHWPKLAGVAMQGHFGNPRLPRVLADCLYNISVAFQQISRCGYRRIGICLPHAMGAYAYGNLRRVANDLCMGKNDKKGIPPLFHLWAGHSEERTHSGVKQIVQWIRRYRPDAIICHSSNMLSWVELAGYGVPEDIGIAHLATDDDVSDWAGIDSNRRVVGSTAVETVVSRIHNLQFGLTDSAADTYIRGRWHGGWTLLGSGKK